MNWNTSLESQFGYSSVWNQIYMQQLHIRKASISHWNQTNTRSVNQYQWNSDMILFILPKPPFQWGERRGSQCKSAKQTLCFPSHCIQWQGEQIARICKCSLSAFHSSTLSLPLQISAFSQPAADGECHIRCFPFAHQTRGHSCSASKPARRCVGTVTWQPVQMEHFLRLEVKCTHKKNKCCLARKYFASPESHWDQRNRIKTNLLTFRWEFCHLEQLESCQDWNKTEKGGAA